MSLSGGSFYTSFTVPVAGGTVSSPTSALSLPVLYVSLGWRSLHSSVTSFGWQGTTEDAGAILVISLKPWSPRHEIRRIYSHFFPSLWERFEAPLCPKKMSSKVLPIPQIQVLFYSPYMRSFRLSNLFLLLSKNFFPNPALALSLKCAPPETFT